MTENREGTKAKSVCSGSSLLNVFLFLGYFPLLATVVLLLMRLICADLLGLFLDYPPSL